MLFIEKVKNIFDPAQQIAGLLVILARKHLMCIIFFYLCEQSLASGHSNDGDVTVQNPVTPSRIRALLPFKTSVAAAASQKKSKYVKWLFDQKVSGSFFPLVMSLFGGFGPDSPNA